MKIRTSTCLIIYQGNGTATVTAREKNEKEREKVKEKNPTQVVPDENTTMNNAICYKSVKHQLLLFFDQALNKQFHLLGETFTLAGYS